MTTEAFIKESDNIIVRTLTEDGAAISGAWTQLDVHILNARTEASVLTLTRASSGNGVALDTSGVLTITPGDITEDLSSLEAGKIYRVLLQVTSGGALNGDYFGEEDSANRLYFEVRDPP